jgi:hypothetical protein
VNVTESEDLPTNRALLSSRLTDATAKQLLVLTASEHSVAEMTRVIADAASRRLTDIEEECSRAETDMG